MATDLRARRGLAPIVGVLLMLAIVVALALIWGSTLVALAEPSDDAPDVAMTFEQTDEGAALVHQGGDELVGDQVTVLGVANRDVLQGRTLTVHDRAEVVPTDEEIEVIWEGNNTAHTLHKFDADTADTD
jgi:flagellin-like protein